MLVIRQRFMVLGLGFAVALAAAGYTAAAPTKASGVTRAETIERKIDRLEKNKRKYEGALRFHSSKKFRWMVHPNQMDKPCWEVRLSGPLKVCMAARAAVRTSSKQLRKVLASLEYLESLLLDTGNEGAWLCIHRYERNPRQGWATNTGNGYYGGLQMDISFQSTYGPRVLGFPDAATMFRVKGTADKWSPKEQMAVAEYARKSGRGYYPWPNTARYCGLI